MNEKKKGLLWLLGIIVAIIIFGVIALVGVGKEQKGSTKNINLGLDLAGGVSITYEAVGKNPSNQKMLDTEYKIQKRVEAYSTESAVYREGDNRINVDIPGVTDANKILEELGKAGAIQFTDSEGKEVLNGADIKTAKAEARQDEMGAVQYLVSLNLNETGAKKFAKATKDNIGKPIFIIYDNKIISQPMVNVVISDGNAVIEGQKTMEEAEQLASSIRIGALPLELKELRSTVVGAKLGATAMNTSLIAGVIGFVLVCIFMIVFYRISGVAASIALSLYVTMILLVLNGFNVTLTLPGVAGIILSIGMAVDANVIIFTRIKEELATGKTIRSAMKIGFDKALSAIVDGNITTLIAAAVLWLNGSGTIKGFAQTLAIGIVLSMFTALFITKNLLYAFYRMGFDDVKYYGVQKEHKVINFTKNIKKFAIVSTVLIGLGIAFLFINNGTKGETLNYSLDFRGGTSIQVAFPENVPENTEIAKLVQDATGETNIEVTPIVGEKAVVIRTKELGLDKRDALMKKFETDYKVDPSTIETVSISGAVSDEMKQDAFFSVVIAAICMLIYIWFRFKDILFGASAVIALIHDVLVVLMVYAVMWISVGNTFIACMLTIVGYSINATIVIFDRIRENKAAMRKNDVLENVVNTSITQTISRSINTSITTFIMVFVLYILGVDSVKEFALPLMAGIICGAYSSICITGALWYTLKRKIKKANA